MKKKTVLVKSLVLLITLVPVVFAFSFKDIMDGIMGIPYSSPEIVKAEIYPQKGASRTRDDKGMNDKKI